MNKFVEVTSVNGLLILVNVSLISYFHEVYINGKYYTQITMVGSDKLIVMERYSEIEEMIVMERYSEIEEMIDGRK